MTSNRGDDEGWWRSSNVWFARVAPSRTQNKTIFKRFRRSRQRRANAYVKKTSTYLLALALQVRAVEFTALLQRRLVIHALPKRLPLVGDARRLAHTLYQDFQRCLATVRF